ncbi:hypothetical protein [Streptomyces sp. DH10]|uniref:hypothetical protein n=1 Tax=Streptomyces sp. DH10 TaxID=3040121 RepID=UPI002443716E|nr:hypothetical protein [Streptomyces sp. DH10]MDG9709248.1 hypothetical protein [Streptomyces sp. DH10]
MQRRVGPAGAHQLLQRDERARLYRIDRVLVDGLQRAYVLADARSDLLRREPPARGTRGEGEAASVPRCPPPDLG